MAQYYKHGTILDISISPSESKLLLELALFDILLNFNLIPPSVAYIYVKTNDNKRDTTIDGKVFIKRFHQWNNLGDVLSRFICILPSNAARVFGEGYIYLICVSELN